MLKRNQRSQTYTTEQEKFKKKFRKIEKSKYVKLIFHEIDAASYLFCVLSVDLIKSYLQSIRSKHVSSIFRCLQLKKAVYRGQDLGI